jgi:hypothetical protein
MACHTRTGCEYPGDIGKYETRNVMSEHTSFCGIPGTSPGMTTLNNCVRE